MESWAKSQHPHNSTILSEAATYFQSWVKAGFPCLYFSANKTLQSRASLTFEGGELAAHAMSQFSQLPGAETNGSYQKLLNLEQLSSPTYASPTEGQGLH